MNLQRFLAILIWPLVFAAAPPAHSSIVYRLVGGACTDGTRELLRMNPPEAPYISKDVAGDLLCSSQIYSEVRLSDSYVPETLVGTVPWWRGDIESIYFQGGSYNFTSYFDYREGALAKMPTTSGPGYLRFWFNDSSSDGFELRLDRTWMSWEEFGPTGCSPGSIPGIAGTCTAARGYFAMGSYIEWQRIPEPVTYSLIGAALAAAVVSRRLRFISSSEPRQVARY